MSEKCIGFIIDGDECYTITSARFKEKLKGRWLENIELLYVPKSRFGEVVLHSFNGDSFQWNVDLIRKYST
ncbi:MAG: hypothetical protein AABY22_03870 [Nanoarchaeota archaeon]